MRKRISLAACGGLAAVTIGVFGAAASASASTTSPVVGYTYINDNTAGANTIAGFDRHADGCRRHAAADGEADAFPHVLLLG